MAEPSLVIQIILNTLCLVEAITSDGMSSELVEKGREKAALDCGSLGAASKSNQQLECGVHARVALPAPPSFHPWLCSAEGTSFSRINRSTATLPDSSNYFRG